MSIQKPIQKTEFKPVKGLSLSPEGKAFSGTAVYTTTFNLPVLSSSANYMLNLGDVNMIAKVTLNGKVIETCGVVPIG